MKFLILALALSAVCAYDLELEVELEPSCDRPLYCNSKLLHYVQMARIFPDSKTFVDLRMKYDEKTILTAFDLLLNETRDQPSKQQLELFVNENFESFNELENWTPEDFVSEPSFLADIKDIEMRSFAKNIHNIWPILGRKVRPIVHEKPENFSMIPVKNGFIIPGVKLNELYYWDTYWIVEGLLVSGMKDTVKGMLSNLVDLQRTFGHIPNGNRWYFQQRSQPPLLSAMVLKYLEATHDVEFLRSIIDALESELQYWMDTQSVIFKKDGKEYTLLRYFTPSKGPRPEWYYEDYTQAHSFDSEERQQQYYNDIKSAAESGWDFSSRWFINQNGTNIGNLTSTHASQIAPVDLNAIFTKSMQNMAYYYSLLHNPRKGAHWAHIAKQWRNSIKEVMWNEVDGIWYDWDLSNYIQRKYFYPSNIAPLWMEVVDTDFINEHAPAIMEYMKKTHSLEFPGGIPTSFSRTGQKWDYPYAWAPLVSMVVRSLEALKTKESEKLAFDVVKNWVRSNLLGYTAYKQLFGKYDVEAPGRVCKEEEYAIQAGFGWTSGATLQMLSKYGHVLKSQDDYYNFNTYKSNPIFWHIPASAYLPSYYKSSKTAPVLTELSPFSEFVSTFTNTLKNETTISGQVESITLNPSIHIKPEEPALIPPVPTKPELIPTAEVKPSITFVTHQPELIPLVPAKLIPSVEFKPEIIPSTTYKPQLVTLVPIKPEVISTGEVRPQLVPSAQVKPELIPSEVVKPELIPSVVVKPERIPYEIRPQIITLQPIKPELVSTAEIRPQQVPSAEIKPELIPSAAIRPELIPSVVVKPERLPSAEEKPWVINLSTYQQEHELPAKHLPGGEFRPEVIPSTTYEPQHLGLVINKPNLILTPEVKPQQLPTAEVRPELVPSGVVKPQLLPTAEVRPEFVPSGVVKPLLPTAEVRPELVLSGVVKPQPLPTAEVRPELVPSGVVKPQLLPTAEVRPELIPSIVVKPELAPSVVATPELKPSAVLKPQLLPSTVVKPELIPSVVVKPELVPSVVIKPELPSAEVKPEIITLVSIKSEQVSTDEIRPQLVPSAEIKPQLLPSDQVKPQLLPSAEIKPVLTPIVAVKPEQISSIVVKPELIPSAVIKPELSPSVVATPELKPSAVLKPQQLPSAVVKPELIPSIVVKPELVPSDVVKPVLIPSVVVTPEVIPAKPYEHEQILSDISLSGHAQNVHLTGSVQDLSAHQKDFFIPEKPVAQVLPVHYSDEKIQTTYAVASGQSEQQLLPVSQVTGTLQHEGHLALAQSVGATHSQAEKTSEPYHAQQGVASISQSENAGLFVAEHGNAGLISGQAQHEQQVSPQVGVTFDYKPVETEKVSLSLNQAGNLGAISGNEYSGAAYNSNLVSGHAQFQQTSPLTTFSASYKPIETEKATLAQTGSVGVLSGGFPSTINAGSNVVSEQASVSYNKKVPTSVLTAILG